MGKEEGQLDQEDNESQDLDDHADRFGTLAAMDNILIWNVRGLNSTEKQARVRAMIAAHNIRLFSLLETRVKVGKMYLSPNWCFFTNHSQHYNGRIVMAWQPSSFDVNILHSTAQLVHCELSIPSNKKTCSLTFIGGFNDTKGREALWTDLQDIAARAIGPWCIGGDFNAVMDLEDRVGVPLRLSYIDPMKSCMDHCGLEEVQTVGRFYTWTNFKGSNRVLSRIDRMLCSSNWCDSFPHTEVTYLPEEEPGILRTFLMQTSKKPFRFNNHWCHNEKFMEVVSV